MKAVDLRPTRDLTRDELLKEVYRLQDKVQELTEKLSKRKPIKEKVKQERKKPEPIVNMHLMESIIANQRRRLQGIEPTDTDAELDSIIDFICDTTKVTSELLKSEIRKAELLTARAAYYYVCKLRGISYKKMGRKINRHHRTAINGHRLSGKYLSKELLELLDNFIKNF